MRRRAETHIRIAHQSRMGLFGKGIRVGKGIRGAGLLALAAAGMMYAAQAPFS
jgi:hypothetical protein